MKNHFKMLFSFIVMALLMVGCENSLEILLPPGPKGDKGDKGDPGISAFELWLEVNGKDPGTPIEDFFNSLKGSDGESGAVPIIGNNGNWFIDDLDTGVPARGVDGVNGVTPVIGENGNWFIDDIDTGVPARGADGVDGKSAYDLWKEAVDKGEMTNKDGSDYTGGNSWDEFLIWLQGGDVFILFEIWKTIPGNSGKTIEEFINELFDCLCNEMVPVAVEEWSLSIFDDQFLLLTVKGMPGMTVRAMETANHANQVVLTENPDGTYTTDQVPRSYTAYTFLLRAEKDGRQTVEIMITVDGDLLLEL